MLGASLGIPVFAYRTPPQIFMIMYFGGTVIAGSWSIVAFGSVWSRRLSKTGAYLGMLLGFIGCAGAKILFSAADYTPPVWLDPFFIGMLMSVLGVVLGSALVPTSADEAAERDALFDAPPSARDAAENRKDHKMWIIYLAFAIFVGLFFLFMYAIPYSRALH